MACAIIAAITEENLGRHHQTPGRAHSNYYTIKWASPYTTLLRPHVSYFTFSPSNGGGALLYQPATTVHVPPWQQ